MDFFERDGKCYCSPVLGETRQVDPIFNWIEQALKSIKVYNSTPIKERTYDLAENYIDNYLLDCSADENACGYENYLEVIPESFHSLQESGDYKKSDSLKLFYFEYIHNYGPIEEVNKIPFRLWLIEHNPKFLKYLENKQLMED